MSTNLMIDQSQTEVMNWASAERDESKLLSKLHECFSLSVENIRNAAFIVRRLEDIGTVKEKLEQAIPSSILRTLRRIAYGQMLPETFLKLNGVVQNKVGSLPISDQRELCDGTPVKVMLPGGDHLMIGVDNLQPDQSRQVFGRGYIRGEAEQISYLADRGKMVSTPKDSQLPATIDRRRRVLVVTGATEFTERQLIAFIAELAK